MPTDQLGPRVLTLVGSLGTRDPLSQHTIRELLADSAAWTSASARSRRSTASSARPWPRRCAKRLPAAPILLMAETRGPRKAPAAAGCGGAITPTLAIYGPLPSRGRYVIDSPLDEQSRGIVISDHYPGDARIATERRLLCWPYLIRDSARISERAGRPGRIDASLLGSAYVLFRWRTAGRPAEQCAPLQRRLQRTLIEGRDRTACRRTAGTCANLLRAWPSLWTFLREPRVATTNNEAERALRAMVIKREISGPTRAWCSS